MTVERIMTIGEIRKFRPAIVAAIAGDLGWSQAQGVPVLAGMPL
jgi:hypothetical protein